MAKQRISVLAFLNMQALNYKQDTKAKASVAHGLSPLQKPSSTLRFSNGSALCQIKMVLLFQKMKVQALNGFF